MKKTFSTAGVLLTRAQARMIYGGNPVDGGDGTPCSNDDDCGTRSVNCEYTTYVRKGFCYLNPGADTKTCHFSGCPS